MADDPDDRPWRVERPPILGGSRSARPLTVADVRKDGQTRTRSKPKGKAAPTVTTREITLVGSFSNPFKGRSDEIQAMKDGKWEPSTDDFVAVGGNVKTTDTYLGVLGAILVEGSRETPGGSITRINIFTHSNSDLIAMAGTIQPGSLSTQVTLDVRSALSVNTLDAINKPGVFFTIKSSNKQLAGKKFTMDDVRARFAKGAVIVIYSCKSGLDGQFVQYMADTFQVKVRGFSDLVGYFPKFTVQPPTIDRRRVGIGRNSTAIETDFHKLDSSTKAVEKLPTTP